MKTKTPRKYLTKTERDCYSLGVAQVEKLQAQKDALLAFAQMIANGGLDAESHAVIEAEARELIAQAEEGAR